MHTVPTGAELPIEGTTKWYSVRTAGALFLPVRMLAEQFNGRVSYNAATKTATLTLSNRVVSFTHQSRRGDVNGRPYTFKKAPFIADDAHIYVTAEDIHNIFGIGAEVTAAKKIRVGYGLQTWRPLISSRTKRILAMAGTVLLGLLLFRRRRSA